MGRAMRVAMIGAGYLGLVSGVCFSDFRHDMVCVDKMEAKIEMLRAGGVSIDEPGLDALMAKNVAAGRLSFATDLRSGPPSQAPRPCSSPSARRRGAARGART